MELNSTGARSARLLSHAVDSRSIAGARTAEDIRVERTSNFETATAASLVLGVLCTGAVLFGLFVWEWQQETSYRAWLLLACVAPLSYAAKTAWSRGLRVWNRWNAIHVTVDSMRATVLFDAVADRIEQVAESLDETCSLDVESFVVYDKALGRTQVRTRSCAQNPKTVYLRLAGDRRLAVFHSRGDDVICGRDHAVTRHEMFILRLKASDNPLADKIFLREWLLSCLDRFKEPPDNVVEVVALDQSSTDWIPEWRTRCARALKRCDGVGNCFFLKRKSIVPMLVDASTWVGKELRIYLIVGPPGTGKTELTIWLAGYLRVPLYRLSLNDTRLSDQIFAQLVSPTSLRHDNAVIQIDEFQETLTRWKEHRQKNGVSMGGFCEVLQGSNSLARGFIVLSGTQEMAETMQDPAFAAVFRRISIPKIILDWLSADDLQAFFYNFILDFVPGCPAEELKNSAQRFTDSNGPWDSGVSIDMVKQFLMQRISSFRGQELSEDMADPWSPFIVPVAMRRRFFDYLCQEGPAREHLMSYPRVGKSVALGEPAGECARGVLAAAHD